MPRDETFPSHGSINRIFDAPARPDGPGEEPHDPGGFPGETWPGDWDADLGAPPDGPPEGAIRRMLGGSGDPPLKWPPGRSHWAVPATAAVAVAVVALFVIGVVLVPGLRGSAGGTLAPGPETSDSATQPAAPALVTAAAAPADGLASAVVPGAGASPTVSAEGYRVYVVGQVRHPGVVSLPAGARVEDALDAAGGPTDAADLTAINLARKVVDGEQITVLKPGEKPPAEQADPAADGAAASGAGDPASTGAGGVASSSDPVDLNTATAAQFDTLPGIGPVMAARIVAWRQQNGGFKTVDDLNQVSGIGDATMARLRPLVRV